MKPQNKERKTTGRSMIEMLSVLAIVGVLSIGGLYWYQLAMNQHRANETIHDVMLRAANVPMEYETYQSFEVGEKYKFPTLGDELSTLGYTMVTERTDEYGYTYKVNVPAVPVKVCERILRLEPTDIDELRVGADKSVYTRGSWDLCQQTTSDTVNMDFYFEKICQTSEDCSECQSCVKGFCKANYNLPTCGTGSGSGNTGGNAGGNEGGNSGDDEGGSTESCTGTDCNDKGECTGPNCCIGTDCDNDGNCVGQDCCIGEGCTQEDCSGNDCCYGSDCCTGSNCGCESEPCCVGRNCCIGADCDNGLVCQGDSCCSGDACESGAECKGDSCCVGSDCGPGGECSGDNCCIGADCGPGAECTGADCCTGSGCGGGGSGSGGSGGSGGGDACYGPGCGPGGTCTNGEAKIVVSGPNGSYPCCGDGCFIVTCNPIYAVAGEVKASCYGCPDYAPYQKEVMDGWINCLKCPDGSKEVTNYTNSGEEKGCCPVQADYTMDDPKATVSGYSVAGAINGSCCAGYTSYVESGFTGTTSYKVLQNGGVYYCAISYENASSLQTISKTYVSNNKVCSKEDFGPGYVYESCTCSDSGDPANGNSC